MKILKPGHLIFILVTMCTIKNIYSQADTVPAPIFVPPGKTFSDTLINVHISSRMVGEQIFYTMDGTDPDTNNASSTRYYGGGPIVVLKTTTLKAISIYLNKASAIRTENYIKIPTGFIKRVTPAGVLIASDISRDLYDSRGRNSGNKLGNWNVWAVAFGKPTTPKANY
jgi:hypothetical protein